MKTCNTCKSEKPLSEFSKCSKAGDGLQWSCKQCCKAINKTRWAAVIQANKNRTVNVASKVCGFCKEEKVASNFHKNPGSKDGLHYACKDCRRVPDEVLELKRKQQQERKEAALKLEVKTCKRCNTEKDRRSFKRAQTNDGMYHICKQCCSVERKTQWINDPEHRRKNAERNKRYRDKPGIRDTEREKKAQYWKENQEAFRLKKKERYSQNKDSILLKQKEYRERNLEAIKERGKQKRECKEYKIKARTRHSKWKKQQYAENPLFVLTERVRARVRAALRSNTAKADKTIVLVGCSYSKLREHLERQFLKGMSWDNMKDWHIDHIIPCASFDLSDPEQQKQCFHYTNLQPLWAADNIRKRDKIDSPVQMMIAL